MAAKPPVSAHPAFPAIVALWFAALLGLGSLVLPAVLFERASEASGLSAIFVAAQAPLGTTARIVIAFAAAVIGVFAGLAIAARVAAANALPPPPVREPAARSAKRPILAHEEFGYDGIDSDLRTGLTTAEKPSETEEDAPDELDRNGSLTGCGPVDLAERPAFVGDSYADLETESDSAIETDSSTEALELEPLMEVDEAASDAFAGYERESNYSSHADAAAPPIAQAERTESGQPSIVELVDRFARALQQHRQHSAALPDQDLPLERSIAVNAPDWAQSENDEDFEEVANEGYSSLLAVKGSSSSPRGAVRRGDIDEPAEEDAFEPVATFPAQRPLRPDRTSDNGLRRSPHVRGEAESALREALEKLQKMSGAA